MCSFYRKSDDQKSPPETLQSGEFYFLEAISKNGQGNDHLAVAVEFPDNTFDGPISNSYLYLPFGDPSKTPCTKRADSSSNQQTMKRYGVFTMNLDLLLEGCIIEQTTAVKVTECAMKCIGTDECKSAVFDNKTGKCTLHCCRKDESHARVIKMGGNVYCELTNHP